MAVATIKPLPPKDAIAALVARGKLAPTFHWQDMWEADHAAAFTVAKSAGFDVLTDIYAGVNAAIADGVTFRDFSKNLQPLLEAKGWWGRADVVDPATGEIVEAQLGSTRRLRTIFDTNMRVSYAAGHWAQFERNKAARPFLRYVSLLVGENRRPEHIARHNLCLPVDHPYWDKWAPPCGWGCKCTLQSLSQRDVDRMRGELRFTPPDDSIRSYVNSRTGEITRVPNGIDPGWAYNPGKAGWRASSVASKLIAAPPELSAAAVADETWPAEKLADEFAVWFDQAAAGKTVDRSMMTIGAFDRPTLDALKEHGVTPQTAAITMQHTQATTRGEMGFDNAAAWLAIARRLPVTLSRAKAVLFDRHDPALLYVFDTPRASADRIVIRVQLGARAAPPGGTGGAIATNAAQAARLIARDRLLDSSAYAIISGAL